MTNTPTPPKQGVRARERNALERISALEQDNQRLVSAIQAAFNDTEQKLRNLSEILDVFVAEKGAEAVQKAILDARVARAVKDAEDSKKALDLALVEGKLAQLEKVEDGALVTGVEKDKDGKELPPGYVQLALSAIKPEFVEKMKGQSVGFTFETEGGGSFEITGIYKPVPQEESDVEVPPAADGSPAMSPDAAGTPPV